MTIMRRVPFWMGKLKQDIQDVIALSKTTIQSWCNERFSLLGHKHSVEEFGISHEETNRSNHVVQGWRSTNNARNLGNPDSSSYFKIGDIVIQCGNFDTCNTVSSGHFTSNRVFDVEFPLEFPTKCVCVVASIAQFASNVTNGNGPQCDALVQGWDKTKFRIMGDYTTTGYDEPGGVSWIAIGY